MEVNNSNECLPGFTVNVSEEAKEVDISEEVKEIDISDEAKEVEVTSAPPPGLLSLTGHVEELLLSHVSRGEGGLQGLLNLRLVCSTTKGWVDDLPLQQGQRLFSNCLARVDLTDLSEIESLETFPEAPPPSHVTSLFLIGAISEFNPKRELWNRFVEIWSPRLTFLEVNELSLPLNCRLGELVASTSIRRLRCDEIVCVGPADVPDFLLQLEELQVDLYYSGGFAAQDMEDPQREATLLILGSVKSLKLPNWKLNDAWDLEFAAQLVRRRERDDADSQLTFKFGTYSYMHEESVYQMDFVTAVAESPSLPSIRVLSVTEDFLRQAFLLAGKKDALKFFCCVESIQRFSGNSDEPLRLTNFPKLRRLECDEGDVRGPIEIPPSLDSLRILRGLPSRAILSPFLTSLELVAFECSGEELVRSLNLIGESCLRLVTLEMDWVCLSGGDKAKKEQLGAPQVSPVFGNLRSLTFHLEKAEDMQKVDFVEAARLVLSEGLRLPRLSLTTLLVKDGSYSTMYWRFENGSRVPLFDAGFLSLLIEGPVGKTLCDVDIDDWAAEGAVELLATLERMARENGRKGQLEAL